MAGQTQLLLSLLVIFATAAFAQPPPPGEETPVAGVGIKVSFRPSIAIVVGIFTMIFSLTFLLLMYAKFCHPSPLLPTSHDRPNQHHHQQEADAAGVPKPVIESLPFFRFAALRGARQGLECAVCLARFDDADLLRLLPRCRHAFHLDCVDRWLDANATCPLCRARVDADDAELGLKYAACSARFVFGGDDDSERRISPSVSGRDILAGIFVERVQSSRFGDEAKAEQPQWLDLDRHKHRIVVSDVVFKSRWSDLNSAALMALDAEMLGLGSAMSSRRFGDDELFGDGEEEMTAAEKKRTLLLVESIGSDHGGMRAAISSGARSMSEIVRLPRVRESTTEMEDRARRRWAPIARRTARWFAGRERRYINRDHQQGSTSHHV